MSTPPSSNPSTRFYAGGLALHGLRAGLGLLQQLAPNFSERLAFGLFSTPLPLKWLNRRALPAPWRAETWELLGRRLCAWRHVEASSQPQRARVLLIHGWGGQAGQFLPLAERLWQAGMDPILLDMPAHGHSSGWRSHMPQFIQTLNAAAQHFGPLQGAVAHSISAVALSHAAARGLPVQRLALLAISSPPRQLISWFGQSFGLRPATLDRMRQRLVQLGATPLERFEPAWTGPRLNQPTLLVHDRQDRAAPSRQSEHLYELLPEGRLLLTEGLGHKRLLADEAVIARVREHLQTLP